MTLVASLMAPSRIPPAKPPKTRAYTPKRPKQMARISGGAVAASVWKMQMDNGATAAWARNWRTTTIHRWGM